MKITYIGHSGFAVELAGCALLFDYYEGTLPAFNSEKPLYVFSSHAHRDHFNFDIFRLRETHPDVTGIFGAVGTRRALRVMAWRRRHMTRSFFSGHMKERNWGELQWKRLTPRTKAWRSSFQRKEKRCSMPGT